METAFSKYLFELRAARRIGLRELAELAKIDPSNYSKYERGVLPAPGVDVLKRIAHGLKIGLKSAEYRQLRDFAHASRGEIPPDILSVDHRIMAALPAFYQHLRSHGLNDDDAVVDNLVKVLRKEV